MVNSIDGSKGPAPINPAPAKANLGASLAKNFTQSIISSAKAQSGGGGFKLQIAATGGHNSKA